MAFAPMSTETAYSKIWGILSDACTNGTISEEQMEQELDCVELMDQDQRVARYRKLKDKYATPLKNVKFQSK